MDTILLDSIDSVVKFGASAVSVPLADTGARQEIIIFVLFLYII